MATPVLFQCIPAYRPQPLVKMIQALSQYDCRILLDLEDGIQAPDDKDLSRKRKEQARKDASTVVAALPQQKFDLRINALDSIECGEDMLLLATLNNISSIFIPKVESAAMLTAFANEYPGVTLNLIIETGKGLQNLDEILAAPIANQIEFVFFGNYDYHLDAGIFPVYEQDSPEYWDIATLMIQKAEQHNFQFGNSPYVHLGDTATLDYAFQQLTEKCKKTFALMSLHRWQTKHYYALTTGRRQPVNHPYPSIPANPASELHYRKDIVKGLSFAFNPVSKRIITPQEYLLLKRIHG